jgi:hypothetical protein
MYSTAAVHGCCSVTLPVPVQPLPVVRMPEAAVTSPSGLTLVTSSDDINSILSADMHVDRSKLPTNRNSFGKMHSNDDSGDDSSHISSENGHPCEGDGVSDSGKYRSVDTSSAFGLMPPKREEAPRRSSSLQKVDGVRGWTATAEVQRTDTIRVGPGRKIPAGGAPAGSRLGAMVGDSEYYERLQQQEEGRGEAQGKPRGT